MLIPQSTSQIWGTPGIFLFIKGCRGDAAVRHICGGHRGVGLSAEPRLTRILSCIQSYRDKHRIGKEMIRRGAIRRGAVTSGAPETSHHLCICWGEAPPQLTPSPSSRSVWSLRRNGFHFSNSLILSFTILPLKDFSWLIVKWRMEKWNLSCHRKKGSHQIIEVQHFYFFFKKYFCSLKL